MSLNEICNLYLQGRKMREQAKQLSNTNLAKKFDRGHQTIARVANHMPCNVPEDEQRLIRACISERDRLKSKAAELSFRRLCYVHKIPRQTLEDYLDGIGEGRAAA